MYRKQLLCCILAISIALTWFSTDQALAQTSWQGTQPQCADPPNEVDVWIMTFILEWPVGTTPYQKVPMEDYVYGVVMGELGASVPNGPYVRSPWSDEVVKAQAVAARTWGAYWCDKWPFYDPNNTRGVKDGDTDQVYRPYHGGFSESTKNHYIAVSQAMRAIYIAYDGLVLQPPYAGRLLDAQFRRDVGNPSKSWTDLGYDYLRSVSNAHTIGFQDGPGWAQTPSQGWTRANDQRASWYQVLEHYYTGVQMMNDYPGTLTADYWNNSACTGSVTAFTATGSINYDWGGGSPIAGVTSDNFCVEWKGNLHFPFTDWYTFFITADDGFQLYWDDVLILNKWLDQAPTQYSVSLPVSEGHHRVRLRYYENSGLAVARMSWIRGRGMIGKYYDEIIAKTDEPLQPIFAQRPDPLIQFDWGPDSSPLDTREGVSRISNDTFSIRWQGHVYLPSDRWMKFIARSDDGVFLKINQAPSGGGDRTLIDHWDDHAPTDDCAVIWLRSGTYPVEARYFENGGGAVINIAWQDNLSTCP